MNAKNVITRLNPNKPQLSFLDWFRRPIKLPWHLQEDYEKAVEQWNKEVGIGQEPGISVNLTKNVFIIKNKKTGEIMNINPEDYEVIEQDNIIH